MYNILIIDDDEPIHILMDNLLKKEFNLLHARSAQEGIDLLSEQQVNLVVSDIHMPGITGLEFLESLIEDTAKKEIPILIMTSLPTVEKEQKALDLGAADFIEKKLLTDDKEAVAERIRMKIIINISAPEATNELVLNKKKLASTLFSETISGDFISTSKKLCSELRNLLALGHISCWTFTDDAPNFISSAGIQLPMDYSGERLKEEVNFQQLKETKEPYFSNHAFDEQHGILAEFSRKQNLPAEMGVPLFALTDKELIRNGLVIPEETDVFACLILKRNKLFSSDEFRTTSKLITQYGTILWKLYSEI